MKKFFVIFAAFALPSQTMAAGLVTCSGPDCTFCSLMQMVNSIIQWIFLIIIPVATLVVAFAGFKLIMSKGNGSALSEAKKLLTNAIIGLIIMFIAWTVIDTILKLSTGGGFGVWNPIECGLQNPTTNAQNTVNLN